MPTTTQEDFVALETALKNNKIEDLKEILFYFDVTATTKNEPSYSNNADGLNCLLIGCRSASSREAMNLVFEKVFRVGGNELLRSQLSATRRGRNSLMLSCSDATSPEVVELLCDKIVEICGASQFKRQVTAITESKANLIMYTDSSSPVVMKVFVEKIVEVGGTELLKNQLSAVQHEGYSCFHLACSFSRSRKILELLATLLHHFGLFKKQFEELKDDEKKKLNKITGIDSSSWTPSPESIAELKTAFEEGSLIHAIHNNQHAEMKDFFLSHSERAKNLFNDSKKLNIVIRACVEPLVTLETMKLLFSQITRIGGGGGCDDHQNLKKILWKENESGESCLLSVCLRYPSRLELVVDAIEEVVGGEFLAKEISKKRPSDGMTCFFALCNSAPEYNILSLFLGAIFNSEFLGRSFLKEEITSNPYLDFILSSRFFVNPSDGRKFFLLIVSLYSITGLLETHYSNLSEEKRETVRRICKIDKSGSWSRAQSFDSTGDVIGEIKKSIKNKH